VRLAVFNESLEAEAEAEGRAEAEGKAKGRGRGEAKGEAKGEFKPAPLGIVLLRLGGLPIGRTTTLWFPVGPCEGCPYATGQLRVAVYIGPAAGAEAKAEAKGEGEVKGEGEAMGEAKGEAKGEGGAKGEAEGGGGAKGGAKAARQWGQSQPQGTPRRWSGADSEGASVAVKGELYMKLGSFLAVRSDYAFHSDDRSVPLLPGLFHFWP